MDEMFNIFVEEAVERIPERYKKHLSSVAFVIDDAPTPEQREKLGLRMCDALYGLYEGVPLPSRGGRTLMIPPDKITIFRHPMLEHFPNVDDLKKQVYETVWHEVAHYFGLDHEQIHRTKNSKH